LSSTTLRRQAPLCEWLARRAAFARAAFPRSRAPPFTRFAAGAPRRLPAHASSPALSFSLCLSQHAEELGQGAANAGPRVHCHCRLRQ
jgi:hypothetical protein